MTSLVEQIENPDEPLVEVEELIETFGPSRLIEAVCRVLRERASDEDDERLATTLDDSAETLAEVAAQLRRAAA